VVVAVDRGGLSVSVRVAVVDAVAVLVDTVALDFDRVRADINGRAVPYR
jgi:hypothetical protein